MLTSKQRAVLRGMAQNTDPIFQIGKNGVGDEACTQIGNALEARELIKVTVLENSGYGTKQAAEAVAEATGADVVSCVGRRFVLYRRSVKKPKIEL